MAERSLRGMSIGAKSLESDENVDFAARTDVAYVCPKGHRTILPFAEGADVPAEWECRCGEVAKREDADPDEVDEIKKPTRTHWDMLMERRTEDELKELLDKRLKMHREGWFPDYE
ncbi:MULTISPECIES: RNA polymerase-binding protein RbpA [unclassified Bifidobacterium]|uniref:RNA polymerase-binding protein RbpA n=1 Tax=unclassified Bifidobacterium TaxID=2608897 RepID=UPI0023F84778|nr:MULTISPECIES: RNA polymerase-binding protein RbpA [unclassified Bifidobacterium]WEV65012.1 RNA polymerase-binding protein RbpA [Bifidobacterium sp. ESL0764]WEV76167.1 RNA polymerase-binding protein RbpA [Bifidobacterium sp. ESL0800]